MEWCSQICEPNRSSSSCLPPLMLGGWKATQYLRVGDPLRYFFLLNFFFHMHFTQKSQSTKVGSRMALKGTMASLLHLALDQFCLQPGRGPIWGAGGSPSRQGLGPDQDFLECHCCHICSVPALSACDRGMHQSHLAMPFPILLPLCNEDECCLSQVITFPCV